MDKIPGDGQKQSQTNLLKDCLIWVLLWPLAGVPAAVFIWAILLPALFLPHYIALPLAFAMGMVPWVLLFGFRKKQTRKFWFFSVVIWGGIVCVIYGYSIKPQHYPQLDVSLVGWEYWVGWGLLLLATILGFYYRFHEKAMERKE